MQKVQDIESSDLPLQEAPLLSEANRVATQGLTGLGVGAANVLSGKPRQAIERTSQEIQGNLSNPTIPERLGRFAGEMTTPKNLLIQGMVARPAGALRNLFTSVKTAGKGIQAVEEAAGVTPQVVDVVPKTKIPEFLRELQTMDIPSMKPQDARDTYAVLSQVIDDTPTNSPNYAIANALKKQVTNVLNVGVPGRAEAAGRYATAKSVEGIKNTLTNVGKGATLNILKYGPLAALFRSSRGH
jgi:hypothetical protein